MTRPGKVPGHQASIITIRLVLESLAHASVRMPREETHPDTYPFETLTRDRQPIYSDQMELMLERMGELPSTRKDSKIEFLQEYVVFAMRGFGSFATTLGTGCYGSELEATLKRQSSTRRDILPIQGICAPLSNRFAMASPALVGGFDYGSTPNSNALMSNDFIPRHAAKLEEFRAPVDKLGVRGKPHAIIYLVRASIEQRNRFFGAIYGQAHISERGNDRLLVLELHRRREIFYTDEVAHMAFEEMVRKFAHLVEEGARRVLRVTLNGIRRDLLAEYALLPREDGIPEWVFPNSFGALSETGFWQAKFIPLIDDKFENGLIISASKNGLSFDKSTAGKSPHLSTGVDEVGQYPIPGLLSE